MSPLRIVLDPSLECERIRLERAYRGRNLSLTASSRDEVEALVVQAGVDVLRRGGLVAFPTETVYGLGADVLSTSAIERLYEVKGRPGSHPVIVHVGHLEAARRCAADFPALAERLAERFWPGPLTLVLAKAGSVPHSVTGGQDSVGVRIPAHPLALRLLRDFGGPVAAPSANRFGRVSPTTAEHVWEDLGEDVDAILDGGPCPVGVESTIIDVRGEEPLLLRPGGVTREAVEGVLGRPLRIPGDASARVSGSLPSHYAPKAIVEVVEPGDVEGRTAFHRSKGLKVKMLRSEEVEAHDLYASLRAADAEGVDVVVAPRPEEKGLGWAVADRLRRAAGPRTI